MSAALVRHEDTAQRDALLPALADGTVTAAVALGAPSLRWEAAADGAISISGSVRPVLGLPTARLVLVPLDRDGAVQWWLLDRGELGELRGRGQVTITVEALPALDRTRPVGTLEIAGDGVVLPAHRRMSMPDAEVRSLALVLAAAESAGIARWCLETASEYAKVRVQFGRPIGQFQAVKHALADMLVAVEQCAAVAWDAAAAWSEDDGDDDAGGGHDRDLSARIAGAVALGAAAHCAKQCIQILGGIGFTWEHDAHFYLKRAMANLQLVAGGDVGSLEHEVTAMAVRGRPPQPRGRPAGRGRDRCGDEIRAVVAHVAPHGLRTSAGDGRGGTHHAALAPTPWGRGALPLEQLVIDEELAAAGVPRRISRSVRGPCPP